MSADDCNPRGIPRPETSLADVLLAQRQLWVDYYVGADPDELGSCDLCGGPYEMGGDAHNVVTGNHAICERQVAWANRVGMPLVSASRTAYVPACPPFPLPSTTRTLTEHKAALIVEAVQRGELDFQDMLSLIEDFDSWADESDTSVARECRGC
jgi:hypothetical protein